MSANGFATNNGFRTRRSAAAHLLSMGFMPLPIPADSKVPVIVGWQKYRITSAEEFPSENGNIGIITGTASGNTVVVDLDHEIAVRLAPQFLPETGCVIGRTSVPNNHWFYRVPGPMKKVEFTYKGGAKPIKFIELLADGQQVVVGPSRHPSGDVYDDIIGHVANVTQDELIESCTRLFHACCDEQGLDPFAGQRVDSGPRKQRESTNGDLKPGEDFNQRGDVGELLEKHGWKPGHKSGNREYWTRPGKEYGISGTLTDGRVFYAFTSASSLDSRVGYSPFALFTKLEHNGDFEAAGKALYQQGYGTRTTSKNGIAHQQTPKTQAENRGKLLDAQIYKPFPLEILPKCLEEFCREQGRLICCDPTLILLPMLAVMAAVIGNSRRVVVRKSWLEPAILWTAAVADSGSGKSPAFDAARGPLTKIQREEFKVYETALNQYEIDKVAYDQKKKAKETEGLTEPQSPVLQDVFLEDTTVEAIGSVLRNRPRGSAIICEELSGWFKRQNAYKQKGGGDEAFYLQSHGGRPAKINRKVGPCIFIPQATLSITGTIQRPILKDVLTGSHIGSGMAARFLFSMPPEFKRKWSDEEIEDDLIERYENLIFGLSRLEMYRTPSDGWQSVSIGMTADAQRRFRQFYDEVGASRPDIESAEMKAAWSKLEGGAARIALVLSCARFLLGERRREVVEDVDIEAGIIASKWFAREAERIYSMLTETPEDKELTDLIDWIQGQGGSVLPADLAKRKWRYRESGSADTVLQKLVNNKAGIWSDTTTTDHGGRPARKFLLQCASTNLTPENQLENGGLLMRETENVDLSQIMGTSPDANFDDVAELFGGREE